MMLDFVVCFTPSVQKRVGYYTCRSDPATILFADIMFVFYHNVKSLLFG